MIHHEAWFNKSGAKAFTPADLTRTINYVVEEYTLSGQASCAYDIGNGLCDSFSGRVISLLDPKQHYLHELAMDQFWYDGPEGDFEVDLDKLRKFGERLPADIPEDLLSGRLGDATHVWLTFRGRHYDAEAPKGVARILDLPFYKRWIANIRAEAQKAKSKAQRADK